MPHPYAQVQTMMRAFSAEVQGVNAAGTGLAACAWHRKRPAGPGCSVLDVGLKACWGGEALDSGSAPVCLACL